MRLSTVFELLLIFLFIAFAASRHVGKKHSKNELQSRQENAVVDAAAKPTNVPNRYCQCANLMCNCCRDFSLPVVSLKGPGCARITYLNGDSMRLTMSFGDRVFRNITLTGKKPSPVCMGLPGGLSKFCGRVYGIQKEGETFKACLALELRALDDVEAALRVSCFKFGPQGVKLEPGKPVPATNNEDEDDDDDDDDDDYGLSDDDDDDDDDDVDFGLSDDDDDEENDVDSGDYTGFSALSDEFLDGFFGSSGNKKKKKPVNEKTTSASVAKPVKSTGKPLIPTISTLKTVSKLTSEYTTKSPSTETMKVEQTTEPVQATSVQMNIKVVQDGVKISDSESTPSMTTLQEEMTEGETTVTQGESNLKGEMTTQMSPVDVKQEQTEEPEESSEEEDEDTTTENKESEESEEENEEAATERGNILDGILGDDENEDDKEDDDDDDDDEEDFRQLRSYVPKGNYRPMTQEEQDKKFPGLSALIRPSPYNSFPRERMIPLPVLGNYFPTPTQDYSSFAFPPVRSARQHKRMRLPPLKS